MFKDADLECIHWLCSADTKVSCVGFSAFGYRGDAGWKKTGKEKNLSKGQV